LKKEKFDELYCSNMNRAKQTAEIVSKKIKLTPKIEESLNEFESEIIKKELFFKKEKLDDLRNK
jgi:broad specificity phosphatase PhoE